LLPVRVAAAWRRAAATGADLLLLLVTAGPLNFLLVRLVSSGSESSVIGDASGLDAALRLLELGVGDIVLPVLPFTVMSGLYFGLFWAFVGRTLGQRLLKLRVVDRRGHTPTPLWVAVRVVMGILGVVPGLLGWVWAAFDLERRAWHDHMARTYVVRDP
jgi:uncharacterized RDD family membrane protein YckC